MKGVGFFEGEIVVGIVFIVVFLIFSSLGLVFDRGYEVGDFG